MIIATFAAETKGSTSGKKKQTTLFDSETDDSDIEIIEEEKFGWAYGAFYLMTGCVQC